MKLKMMLAAVSVACAGSAMALPLVNATAPGGDLGVLTSLPSDFLDISVPGAFSDSFSFTVSSKSIVSGSLAAIFGSVDVSSVSFDGGSSLTLTSGQSGLGFSSSILSAGTHTLSVKGMLIGKPYSGYAGNVYATAAPVPEPESLALALAGVGVTVSVMRRRSRA